MDGRYNTANGDFALYSNTSGTENTAIGDAALYNNTANLNIAVGAAAGETLTTGDNNIDIGNIGVAGEANTIRIGTVTDVTDEFSLDHPPHTATFIAGINGATVTGTAVLIDATTGQLGTILSSQRFKDAIKPMDKASEAILSLKPVTFRYKHELDPKGIPQFGLIAEEVAKVNPDLVVRDRDGKVYSVRYEAVNAMLLNEFLKEHLKVEEQHRQMQEQQAVITQLKLTVAQQEKTMELVNARLKQQEAQIQKVSDQFEMGKAAARVVGSNQ